VDRVAAIEQLAARQFDLLVVGGGIIGAGIAEVGRAVPRERLRLAAPPAPGVAESLAGARRYDEAIALYRAALARPGADAAALNTRLGMALFLAGRRADAEAAFRLAAADTEAAMQPGNYADLASFWLTWLAQPPATR